MRLAGIIGALAFLAVLALAIGDFPPVGDPQNPASRHVVPRYIERTLEETGVPNTITSILADYRGYDTNFETTVIFTAAAAVILILGGFPWRDGGRT